MKEVFHYFFFSSPYKWVLLGAKKLNTTLFFGSKKLNTTGFFRFRLEYSLCSPPPIICYEK